MPKSALSLCVFLTALSLSSFAASIKDIRIDKLPNDPALQAALADARELEPWVRAYSANWTAPVTKAAAAARLASDMKAAEAGRIKYPDNEEVALVSGLIASYAFNIDVKDSWNVAPAAFNAAIKLDSSDARGTWFLAAHNCQTVKLLKEGMSALLAVESSGAKDLSSPFWLDYMACATETLMPAHAYYAATKLAPGDRSDPIAVAILSKAKGEASATQAYKPEQLWSTLPVDGGMSFRSYACGISFTVPSGWEPQVYPVSGGKCAIVLQLPPMPGVKGSWTPNIVVMAHMAVPGDSFVGYATLIEGKRGAELDNRQLRALCTFANCITADMFDAHAYPTEGGGHGYIMQFERSRPSNPGFALETSPIPPTADSTGAFRSPDYLARFPGAIYYSILLDSAVSILPKANEDFVTFVKSIRTD